MISKKHRCIFIHIPKCAGTSIEHFLYGEEFISSHLCHSLCVGYDKSRNIWMQHATAEQIKKYYTDKFDEYFKFAVVRNPWSKMLSDYFWMIKELNLSANNSFEDFLLLKNEFNTERLRFPAKSPRSRVDHLLPQYKFIYDKDEKKLVDQICKFESLHSDFNNVCEIIGLPKDSLTHQNSFSDLFLEDKVADNTDQAFSCRDIAFREGRIDYREYYTEKEKEIVAEKYRKDIEFFNYEF